MQKIIDVIVKLWSNPVVKTIIMAGAGATGGVLAAPGQILLDQAHIIASATAMLFTLIGLYTQHPTTPATPVKADDAATSVPPKV